MLLEPNASICQNNETSDIMICDNLNSAVISNICDDKPVFVGDNNGTDIDYNYVSRVRNIMYYGHI